MKRPAFQRMSRRLSLENLESRQLMAGDVTVQVVDGDLRIIGDGAGNGVEVSMPSPGVYRISGFNHSGGTTRIRVGNLIASAALVSGVTDDINISLAGGSDFVSFRGTPTGNPAVAVPDDLTIDAGAGSDFLSLRGVHVGDDVLLELGEGASNTLVTDQLIAGMDPNTSDHDLTVRGGEGNDLVYIRNSIVADELLCELGTGDAGDHATIENSTIYGVVNFFSGGGNDDVEVLSSFVADDANFDLGEGDDVLFISQSFIGDDVTLDGGAGQDTANLLDSRVDEVFARLGAGNDLLIVSRFRARSADWDGQGDTDEFRFNEVVVDEAEDFDNFESGSIRAPRPVKQI